MRTVLAVLIALSACAAVYACNAFSGSETGQTATPDDASAEGTIGTNDATLGTTDTGTPITGDIFDDNFEGASTCAGWSSSSVTYSISDAGRNGGQSCQVCLSASGNISFYRSVAVDAGVGPYELDFFMMMPDAGTPRSGWGRLVPSLLGQAEAPALTNVNLTPGVWVPVQAVVSGDGGADIVQIDIYDDPEVQAECFYIDDVRLFAQH